MFSKSLNASKVMFWKPGDMKEMFLIQPPCIYIYMIWNIYMDPNPIWSGYNIFTANVHLDLFASSGNAEGGAAENSVLASASARHDSQHKCVQKS